MRIKKGFELKQNGGQNIIIYKGKLSGELDNSIVLTDTAVFLWNLLKENDVTKTQMLEAIVSNFDISTVLALGDIDVFVRTMKENGIIEE